eukprot:g10636.t1
MADTMVSRGRQHGAHLIANALNNTRETSLHWAVACAGEGGVSEVVDSLLRSLPGGWTDRFFYWAEVAERVMGLQDEDTFRTFVGFL